MQSCDLAVSAAGSTLLELCACGIPTITYVLDDNQILGAKAFEKAGLMIYTGDVREEDSFTEKLNDTISVLCMDLGKRKDMYQRMTKMVDGCGAVRLVRELTKMI